MLRSWTNRSFWMNLLGEQIVLVHVIHWLIFLIHWNPTLHSSATMFALRKVSSCQRLTNPRANGLRVWDETEHMICWIFWMNIPFTYRFAFESDSELEGDTGVNSQTSPVPVPQKWISSRPNPTKKLGENPVPFHSRKNDSHSLPLPCFFFFFFCRNLSQ